MPKKASKSPPQVSVGLYRVGFDIRPIVTHHETPAEPPCLSGDDADESWSLLSVRESVPGGRRESVWKASKSVPHVGVGLYRAGFDIISIDIHHETPVEPSASPGDDDDASRSLRPVRESIPRWEPVGGAKASESAPHVGVGLHRADFYIRSIIVTYHETSAEPSRSSEDDADASRSHPTGATMVP